MRDFIEGFRTPINVLGTNGYIGQVDSLGFATAKPLNVVMDDDDGQEDNWDEPKRYIDFVGGWGPDRDMFIANAVRKMRAMLREERETLFMRLSRFLYRLQVR